MKNVNNVVLSVLVVAMISGCSSNSKKFVQNSDNHRTPVNFNLNQLKGEKELFITFAKNADGTPTSTMEITAKQGKVLNFFKNKSTILRYDCIRIVNDGSVSVCDEPMWFEFGKENQTTLTTTKPKNASFKNVSNGVLTTAITPLSVVADVLSGDISANRTRKRMVNKLTDPVQDFEELEKVKDLLLREAKEEYDNSKTTSMAHIEAAVMFFKSYPKDDFSDIINSHISSSAKNKDHRSILKILSVLNLNSQQKSECLQVLRSMNTFGGFATAFDLSGEREDAKKAQNFATTENDKQKTEYMAIKLLKKQYGTISDLFTYSMNTQEGTLRQEKGSLWFSFFKENIDKGVKDFSCDVHLAPTANAIKNGIFKYGTYDLTIKATLKIPKHHYRRSFWQGNVDQNEIDESVREKVIRLSKPNFSGNAAIKFSDVMMNYKDRGTHNGTTEFTVNGNPTCEIEVKDVSLAES
jgi:hypothetical protein